MIETKECTKCRKIKPIECFSVEKRTKIGIQSRCKECKNKHSKEYWYRDHQKSLLRKRRYRKENGEKINKKSREKYHINLEKNREKNNKYQKVYYHSHPEILEKVKDRARKNRLILRERERKYNEAHLEKYKEKNRRNNLKKKMLIKIDPGKRIRERMSSLIRTRLKSRLSGKNGKKRNEYLPYRIEKLMEHLEKLFKPGMTWDNYGKWHVDHIIPDCSFKYKTVDDEEFKKCWALSNLQPLWALENKIKGGRILDN